MTRLVWSTLLPILLPFSSGYCSWPLIVTSLPILSFGNEPSPVVIGWSSQRSANLSEFGWSPIFHYFQHITTDSGHFHEQSVNSWNQDFLATEGADAFWVWYFKKLYLSYLACYSILSCALVEGGYYNYGRNW